MRLVVYFTFGRSTVGEIVHDTVSSLYDVVSTDTIMFPVILELEQTMQWFEEISGLPMCCGDIDGTFVQIVKPEEYRDWYWCYKGYPIILLFACVDSRGVFAFVDVGATGSIGDAAVYINSVLKDNIGNGVWLN